MATISDERLAEMLAGLDGVTPGPWKRVEAYAGLTLVETPNGTLCKVPWDRPDMGNAHREAGHIARCDPDTMRQILTELQSLRSQAEVGEAVAWMHPRAGWCDADRINVLVHCQADGSDGGPIPLYARPAPIEITEDQALIRDLADCLEDMTKHYVEVRNDLYGFEAAEEIEVIAAGKLISKAKSQQEGETE